MTERHAPRFPAARIGLVAAHDLFMAAAAFEIAVWARYYTYGAPQDLFFLWEGTAVFTAVCALVFAWSGLFRGIWHYASMTDLFAITRAVSIAIVVFVPVMFTIIEDSTGWLRRKLGMARKRGVDGVPPIGRPEAIAAQ